MPSKPHLALRNMGVGGWALLAGTPTELKRNLGLAVATFHWSVNPTYYQSHEDAKRRAEMTASALMHCEEFASYLGEMP
jgi:hypothetical protein